MDWSKVKSAVATVDGLDVTFEDDGGQLGAVRVPYAGQQSPVRQKPGLPTYRLRLTSHIECKDSQGQVLFGAPVQTYGPAFTAVSDEAAKPKLNQPIIHMGNGCIQKVCWALEKLEAKAGYASSWKTILVQDGCLEYMQSPPGELSGQS